MHQHNVMKLQSICHQQTDLTLLWIAQCHSVRIFRKINSGSILFINITPGCPELKCSTDLLTITTNYANAIKHCGLHRPPPYLIILTCNKNPIHLKPEKNFLVYELLYGGSERSNALQLKKTRRRSTQITMETEKTKRTNIKEITHTNGYNTTEVFFGETKTKTCKRPHWDLLTRSWGEKVAGNVCFNNVVCIIL